MIKGFIKELIIALLLCLAIILVLGILLYNYNPSSKTLPDKVAYTTPEKIKEELNNLDGVDESKVVMTYEIDSTDLNNYRRVRSYVPGKSNPFSSYKNETTRGQDTKTSTSSSGTTSSGNNNTTETNTNDSNVNSSNTNNSNTSTSTSSEGTYLPNRGTK